MQSKGTAIRKRTQIASANRLMFLWVAGISVVVGISLVVVVFLVQMLLFNEKVLSAKNQTVSTLETDNNNVKPLQQNENRINTNQALISVKAKPDDQAIQVILDALPSDANSLALGASLQSKLLAGISGLSLVSLQVDPVAGIESLSTDNSTVGTSSTGSLPDSQHQITFRFSVSGNEAALKQALINLENSIRTIDITTLKIESQGSKQTMTVTGRAFYEPAVNLQLTEKVIK